MLRSRLFTMVTFAGVLAFGAAAVTQCGPGGSGPPPSTTTSSTSSSTTTSTPIIDPIFCRAGGTLPGSCSLIAPGVNGMVQTSGTGTFAVDDVTGVAVVVASGTGPATQSFATIPGHDYTLFAQPLTTMTFH